MGTFNEDNRIGAFSAKNVDVIYSMFTDGDISAEQALQCIAIEAGVIKRTPKQEALGDLIRKVDAGELPVTVLIAAVER